MRATNNNLNDYVIPKEDVEMMMKQCRKHFPQFKQEQEKCKEMQKDNETLTSKMLALQNKINLLED